MAEAHAGVSPEIADPDQRTDESDIDTYANSDDDSLSTDDFEVQARARLLGTEHAVDHASFTVRHGFEDVDPGITMRITQAGVIVLGGAALLALYRVLRRKEKLSTDNAWAWATEERPPPRDQIDLSRPLLGYRIAVAENIPCPGHPPVFGRVSHADPSAPHHVLRSLCDAGSSLCGAARVDARPPHTPAACATCAGVGNPGHAKRAVLGSHGALCALVAAGSVDIGMAIDSGGESLQPAACMGLYTLRTSTNVIPLQSSNMPLPGTGCASMAFTVQKPELMLKVAKALSLPGTTAVDELRVMLAADMFVMTEVLSGEKVTNGIVTRSITTWLSDREHARQVNLLEWLAKELSGWDYFAPVPRGSPDPSQVLLAITASHKIIQDYEWHLTAPEGGWIGDPDAMVPEVERSDYDAALQLRDDLHAAMRKALTPMVFMVLPVLAGAAPKVASYQKPLSASAAAMAAMSQQMTSFIAMTGCPAAVLPVPALTARGAPWSVMLLGCHRCDLQLSSYAAKMGEHIQKTVRIMQQEQKEEKSGKKQEVKGMTAVEKQARADMFRKQGNEAFKAGKYKDAVALFTAAIEMTPRSAVLFSNRAQANINLEQFQAAVHDCDRSLQCQFTPKAALRRGTACVALALWEEAITSFEAVLAQEPHNTQAQEQLQLCHDMLGGVSDMHTAPIADESGML